MFGLQGWRRYLMIFVMAIVIPVLLSTDPLQVIPRLLIFWLGVIVVLKIIEHFRPDWFEFLQDYFSS